MTLGGRKAKLSGGVLGPTVQRSSVKEEVYNRVRQAILQGEFAHGQRLIPQDIAASIGVSRTPVVLALDRLKHEALLEVLHNGGYAVVGVSESAAREITEVRMVLEAFAARLAASRRVSDETIAELRRLDTAMRDEFAGLKRLKGVRRASAMERIVSLNKDFHQTINKASENSRLIRLLNDTLDLAETTPVLLSFNEDELGKAIENHTTAIDQLERGDADGVENTLREHIGFTLSTALPRLKLGGK